MHVTLRISMYPNQFGLQFQTSSDTENYGVFETIPTKQGAQNVNIMYCRKVCKILRCITLRHTIIYPCNTSYFYVSKLVWIPFPNQFRYGEIQNVTQKFYRIRQCSISPYFTFHFAVMQIRPEPMQTTESNTTLYTNGQSRQT